MTGTLGQVPLTGGTPRQIAEASNGPTGRLTERRWPWFTMWRAKQRLEFPLGHVLYETSGWISHPARFAEWPRDRVSRPSHPTMTTEAAFPSSIWTATKNRLSAGLGKRGGTGLVSGWERSLVLRRASRIAAPDLCGESCRAICVSPSARLAGSRCRISPPTAEC